MVGAAECAERLEYGGPPAGPGRVGLHLVNASGKECYRKREGRRYTGPAHSAGTQGAPPRMLIFTMDGAVRGLIIRILET